MPSFLDYQEEARKRTRIFVALYLLCLVGIVAVLGMLALAVTAMLENGDLASLTSAFAWENADVALATGGIALAIIGLATLVRSNQLSGGGGKVAESLGGRLVDGRTRDMQERRLLNIVEEMAIAARIPVPAVYVLDGERGVNAFAAGTSPDNAAVAVTRGALENLTREELQCVIGHEFSHILNGDMRLNIQMLGSIFGLLCIAILGRIAMRIAIRLPGLRSRRSNGKESGGIYAVALAFLVGGLALWLLGQIGVLFGRILQSVISRQREYLADASAVQFTRNPAGMASALKTIGAVSRHAALDAPHAGEVAHMLFASGGGLSSLFATHPPLVSRIRRFEPGFDGNFDESRAALDRRLAAARAAAEAERRTEDDGEALRTTLLGAFARRAAASLPGTPPPLPPSAAFTALPAAAFASLRNPAAAPAVLCGALLAEDGDGFARQLAALRGASETARFPGLAADASLWRARLGPLPLRERLALCEIAASSLRAEPEETRRDLASLLHTLVADDGLVSPFEFAVEQLFRNRLLPFPVPAAASTHRLAEPARTALHALAAFGVADDPSCAAALAAGLATLPESFRINPNDPPGPVPTLRQFSAALDQLRALSPADKKGFLAACSATVRADGILTDDESVVLSAIADTVGAAGWTPPT